MEIEKANFGHNIKHIVFDELQGCVSAVASEDCLASSEIKLYLKKRYPKFEKEIFEKYSVYGRSSLHKYKILNNWQMKRLIRDIDTICVFAGTRKRCVVDRSVKVTKECMEVLKGMDCKPVINYDKPPCFKSNLKTMSVSEAASELNIKMDRSFWDESEMDSIDYVDRPAIRRRIKEDEIVQTEIYYSDKLKFENKIKQREANLEGFAPVKKSAGSYMDFKKALMCNVSINTSKPIDKNESESNSKYSSSRLLLAAVSKSKANLIKNLVLSGNLETWTVVKNKQKPVREDLHFNDNLISVNNYYSSLFKLNQGDGVDCLTEITKDYIRLSTKVAHGCIKMETETVEEIKGIEFGKSEKLKKRLLKKLSKGKMSGSKSRKKEARINKRSENSILTKFHDMNKSKMSKVAQKISNLVNFLSSDLAGNRFERLFDQHYPHHKKHLSIYKNFKIFLNEMDKVAISKIWSKTQTQEVVDLPEEFYKGVEDVKMLSLMIDRKYGNAENSLISGFSVGIENVRSIMTLLEKEGAFKGFVNQEKANRKLLAIKEEKTRKEEGKIREREKNRIAKKEKKRMEAEYYEQFDCENF